jgi:hypothetical protein
MNRNKAIRLSWPSPLPLRDCGVKKTVFASPSNIASYDNNTEKDGALPGFGTGLASNNWQQGLVASPKYLLFKNLHPSKLTLPHRARGSADCESQPNPVPTPLLWHLFFA